MSGECDKCGEHNLECNCERCNTPLELCPADWPWNPDYWICPKCESTYVLEKEKSDPEMEKRVDEILKDIGIDI